MPAIEQAPYTAELGLTSFHLCPEDFHHSLKTKYKMVGNSNNAMLDYHISQFWLQFRYNVKIKRRQNLPPISFKNNE